MDIREAEGSDIRTVTLECSCGKTLDLNNAHDLKNETGRESWKTITCACTKQWGFPYYNQTLKISDEPKELR